MPISWPLSSSKPLIAIWKENKTVSVALILIFYAQYKMKIRIKTWQSV